jgi:hypothetical protein
MTTLKDLRDDVRSHLDETIAEFWTEDELDRWVYEGLRDVARRTECLPATKAITLISNQAEYEAPTDMLRIHKVEYVQDSSTSYLLNYVPFHNIDDIWYHSRQVAGSNPHTWTFWGYPGNGKIYVYPSTSSTVKDGLLVYYYRLPRKLSSPEDPADIPSGWEDLIPLYVEVLARRKESKDTRWRDAQLLYEQRLEDMIRHTRLPSDQASYVSMAFTSPTLGDWW